MDVNIWKMIEREIRVADQSLPRPGRRPRFGDRLIARMYFWSVAHDRPLCWAARRSSYSRWMRPRCLPSLSQFCRRVKSPRLEAIITRVEEALSGRGEQTLLMLIDGKALPIGESSKDPDARTGRGHGKFSRGYKLHALGDQHGRIRAFRVTPMNNGEPTVAREHLVEHIPAGCLVLADGNYDGRKLYTAVGERDATLLTPQKKNPRTQAAFANTCPERRRVMELWRDRPHATRMSYARRAIIERIFSALSCYGGGLGPLPAWVRRLTRVTRWVTAKIALYNARVSLRTTA
jgi:transposase